MSSELESTREWHRTLINKVYENDYYVSLFERVERNFPDENNISLNEIYSFWNQFWLDLPDSRSIHRPPFYEICDICEGNYLQGEEA